MAKFNTPTTRPVGRGPLGTTGEVTTTHEGGTGYQRDVKSELFLHLTTRFVGEDSFYQGKDDALTRLRVLIAEVVKTTEGWEWLKGFGPWLRGSANIRSGAIVLAVEAVHARLDYGELGDGNRQLIDAVLQRADEPGELLAYWTSRYGKAIPKPVKRGVADAVARLYNERSFLRYDSTKAGVRFADVLDLTHPTFKQPYQRDLFEWALATRHNRDGAPGESLTAIQARWELSRLQPFERHLLAQGAITDAASDEYGKLKRAMAGQWEWLISWLGESPKDQDLTLAKSEQWELASQQMGYMALLRNLRNFDEAGVSDEVAGWVIGKLKDPEEVKQSRQLPFRFYSAYRTAPSLRWGHALDVALAQCLANVPELPGDTLALIDTSASMTDKLSGKSTLTCVEAAAIFALALKLKNPDKVDVYGFADGQFEVTGATRGMSLLKAVEAFIACVGRVGHGTQIQAAVTNTYQKKHDRVLIFTDMQTFRHHGYHGYGVGDVSAAVPKNVPVYSWDLRGYQATGMPLEGNRHEMGGLTDATFRLIPFIEAGQRAAWPWLQD